MHLRATPLPALSGDWSAVAGRGRCRMVAGEEVAMNCNLCRGTGKAHHPTCPRWVSSAGLCRCEPKPCPICRSARGTPLQLVALLLLALALVAVILFFFVE